MVLGSSPSSSLFCAAVVASAHGVQGHVKVKCFLEDPAQLKTYSPFSNEEGEPVFAVKKVLSQNKDILILSFQGITDRTKAEELRGAKLMLAQDRLPNLSDNTYYHKDLIGLSVISFEGQSLGMVHALYNFGAGDLLEIKTAGSFSTSQSNSQNCHAELVSASNEILKQVRDDSGRECSHQFQKTSTFMIPFTHEMVPEINLEKGTLRLSKDAEPFLKGGEL